MEGEIVGTVACVHLNKDGEWIGDDLRERSGNSAQNNQCSPTSLYVKNGSCGNRSGAVERQNLGLPPCFLHIALVPLPSS